ncbi:hypothetical protein U1Q18_016843 [Sarracenia purpurea var. burkii]
MGLGLRKGRGGVEWAKSRNDGRLSSADQLDQRQTPEEAVNENAAESVKEINKEQMVSSKFGRSGGKRGLKVNDDGVMAALRRRRNSDSVVTVVWRRLYDAAAKAAQRRRYECAAKAA